MLAISHRLSQPGEARLVEETFGTAADNALAATVAAVELRFKLRWLALIPVATALMKRKKWAGIKAGLRAMFKIL